MTQYRLNPIKRECVQKMDKGQWVDVKCHKNGSDASRHMSELRRNVNKPSGTTPPVSEANGYTPGGKATGLGEYRQVGKYTWATGDESGVNHKGKARVCFIENRPEIVVIYTQSQLKRDWYKYLDMLLGESSDSGGYVLVIPRMTKTSPPSWFGDLKVLKGRDADTEALFSLSDALDNGTLGQLMEDEAKKWLDKVLVFLNQFNWVDRCYFDFHNGNILKMDNGEWVITDPLEEYSD